MSSVYVASVASTSCAFSAAKWRSMTSSAASTAILPSLPFLRSADVEATIDRVGDKVKDICYLGPKEVSSNGQDIRLDGRRLGAAGRLRTASCGAAGSRQGAAPGVGAGVAGLLRSQQHSLHHEHADRDLEQRQVRALVAADAGPRAHHVGFRLCRPPPSDLLPMA